MIIGKERQKSKVIDCTINPKWREAYDFYWYEEQDEEIEFTIFDKDVGSKDDFMGRYVAVFLQPLLFLHSRAISQMVVNFSHGEFILVVHNF